MSLRFDSPPPYNPDNEGLPLCAECDLETTCRDNVDQKFRCEECQAVVRRGIARAAKALWDACRGDIDLWVDVRTGKVRR